jgi:hypothetical protein
VIGPTRRLMPLIDGGNELIGHVEPVDFWTFSCLNWLLTQPYIRAWA